MDIESLKSEDGMSILKISGTMSGKEDSEKLIGHMEGLVNDGEQKFVLDLSMVACMTEETVQDVIDFFEGIKGQGGELYIA